jgi:hypothetical protein
LYIVLVDKLIRYFHEKGKLYAIRVTAMESFACNFRTFLGTLVRLRSLPDENTKAAHILLKWP